MWIFDFELSRKGSDDETLTSRELISKRKEEGQEELLPRNETKRSDIDRKTGQTASQASGLPLSVVAWLRGLWLWMRFDATR